MNLISGIISLIVCILVLFYLNKNPIKKEDFETLPSAVKSICYLAIIFATFIFGLISIIGELI